jgi:hypothetical protein
MSPFPELDFRQGLQGCGHLPRHRSLCRCALLPAINALIKGLSESVEKTENQIDSGSE